jgi:hypothetical protein
VIGPGDSNRSNIGFQNRTLFPIEHRDVSHSSTEADRSILLTPRRWPWQILALVTVLVVSIFLRLYELGSIPPQLWYDEVTGHYIPFLVVHQYDGALPWSLVHGTPPGFGRTLYYLLSDAIQGNLWIAPFATSDATWLRLPAAAYGVGLVGLLYLSGKELSGKLTGIVAAAIGAAVPWTLYYSRFMVPIAAFEFWTLLAIYLLVIAEKRLDRRLFTMSVLAGTAITYTHFAGIVVLVLLFFPLWLWVYWRVFAARNGSGLVHRISLLLWALLPEIGLLILLLFPFLLLNLEPGNGVLASAYYVWQHCSSTSCTFAQFGYGLGQSWSPDFLAVTGGLQGATQLGFEPHISIGGVLQSGGGYTGMLSPLGFLIYPALLLPILYSIKNRAVSYRTYLIVFLTLSYSVVGGSVYYDNPNAARLAFAVGPFIILIAEFLLWSGVHLWRFYHKFKQSPVRDYSSNNASHLVRRIVKPSRVIVGAVVLLVIVCSAPYGLFYFTGYSSATAQYFFPQIVELESLLSSRNLWNSAIAVLAPQNLTYVLPGELALYDPIQPPTLPIDVFNGSLEPLNGMVANYPDVTFASIGSSAASGLESSFTPFVPVAGSPFGNIWIYQLYGSTALSNKLASVQSWSSSPQTTENAGDLNWTPSPPGNGVNLTVTRAGGNLSINASLNTSRPETFWTLTSYFPQSIPLLAANFLQIAWRDVGAPSGPSISLRFIVSNDTSDRELPVILAYPGDLVNLFAGTSELSSLLVTGLVLSSSILPGQTQTVWLGTVDLYDLLVQPSPPCMSQNVFLNGTQFDVAIPNGTSLTINGDSSSTNVTLCLPSDLPESVPLFLGLNLTIKQPFARPMNVTVNIGNVTEGSAFPGGATLQTFRLYLRLPTTNLTTSEQVKVSLSLKGQIYLTSLGIVAPNPS